MAKAKSVFQCQHCAAQYPKWAGQCSDCGAWNSLSETPVLPPSVRQQGYAGQITASVTPLSEINSQEQRHLSTGNSELDRVLGGGIVAGSVILIGGDPGIGKSTLLLQTLTQIQQPALYVTGEESLEQVRLRAERLGLPLTGLKVLAATQIETILTLAQQERPSVMVIDSIQTIYTEDLSSAPGGVAQIRESAAKLVQYAKQSGCAVFLVGHVTKEGALAGPRVLEHMVDTVLYFEGQADNRFRAVRAIKNRFGAVNELGVFAMTDKGLREVSNPSALFLSSYQSETPGSVVMVTWEGTRPLLVEVQALVDESHLGNPRRVTVGLDQNRLSMLLAVLHRHGGIPTYDKDVFLNVVGGVRVSETAADLAAIFAVLSSLHNTSLMPHLVVFGEVGLAGEIRPVQSGQERLKEAAKHGFTHAIVPAANQPKQPIPGMQIFPVKHLAEALTLIR